MSVFMAKTGQMRVRDSVPEWDAVVLKILSLAGIYNLAVIQWALGDKTSYLVTKPTIRPVHPAKTQISLCIHRVAVHMKKHWVLSYPLSALWRLIRLGGCPGWSESSLCAHVTVRFVMRRFKCIAIQEKQRCRSACTSALSDKCLYCLLPR